jgi:hypothetical protein
MKRKEDKWVYVATPKATSWFWCGNCFWLGVSGVFLFRASTFFFEREFKVVLVESNNILQLHVKLWTTLCYSLSSSCPCLIFMAQYRTGDCVVIQNVGVSVVSKDIWHMRSLLLMTSLIVTSSDVVNVSEILNFICSFFSCFPLS